jgi:dihydrofolate reductase
MIVISRQPHYQPAGCLVAHSLEEALEVAAARGEDEAYVIGGSEIFAQALKVADRLYLTLVHTRAAADTFFPPFDRQDWEEIQSSYHPADAYNDYPSTFSILVRKRR